MQNISHRKRYSNKIDNNKCLVVLPRCGQWLQDLAQYFLKTDTLQRPNLAIILQLVSDRMFQHPHV